MRTLRLIALFIGLAALLAAGVGFVAGGAHYSCPVTAVACVGIAIGFGSVTSLRTYQFTMWIVAAVVVALLYPSYFLNINGVDLRDKRLILAIMQLVMFGMGTQMSLRDFAGLGRLSYGVIIGVVLQFTIMPLAGYALAIAFNFPPEVAAGIVLIGSCSSGLASNVMSYLAKANLALSVTLTAIGTLTAPLTTPLWMKLLAGRMVPVDFVGMMLDIIKLVIVPIGAALLHDYLKHAPRRHRRFVYALAAIGVGWLSALVAGVWSYAATQMSGNSLAAFSLVAFIWGAIIAGVLFHLAVLAWPALEEKMPIVSMFGIIFFTAVTTAAGRPALLTMGWLLLIVSILHNLLGLILGYSLSRLFGLDVTSARTVALEVGFQNGGMASGLAGKMGMLGTVGLAPAVFSPWQNFFGSILANHWRRHPPKDEADDNGESPDQEATSPNKSL